MQWETEAVAELHHTEITTENWGPNMKFYKFAIAGVMLPFLAACAAGPDTMATKNMSNTSTPFNKALQSEYVMLAEAENKEYDTEDAFYFNNKAKMAAKGDDVQPQPLKERKVTGDAKWELEAARQALRGLLLSGGKKFAPAESARAQAMFDCWIQEQEEGDQPKHINACRSAFDEAFNAAEAKRPAPKVEKKAMKKEMALPGPYVVYFDFDSFDLTASGEAVIAKAAKEGMAAGAKGVIVTGHTDTAGNNEYNEGLSRARAATVGNQLMIEGIARSMVKRNASGETAPAVNTDDGAKEARNRRVTVTFTR